MTHEAPKSVQNDIRNKILQLNANFSKKHDLARARRTFLHLKECPWEPKRDPKVVQNLLNQLPSEGVDIVLSDMAPNMSGNKAIDQPRSMLLVETALNFCKQTLKPGGIFLCKVFQGEGFDDFVKNMRANFATVNTRKPDASRGRSTEVYLLGKNFKQR